MTILFSCAAIFWFFYYPYRERQRYIEHYKNFLNERYKNDLERVITLEINNDFILSKTEGNESKILTKEIEEINEIPTLILLKLKTGDSYVLPKSKIKEIDQLKLRLKELAVFLKIKYNHDENWKWK
ncbi:MAG: YcxB family protein [Bacteroidia bacterium]